MPRAWKFRGAGRVVVDGFVEVWQWSGQVRCPAAMNSGFSRKVAQRLPIVCESCSQKPVRQESTLAKRMRDRLHFGSAEAGQMHQSILKTPRNRKDIDVRFTEIYRRVEYHGSIFWWG